MYRRIDARRVSDLLLPVSRRPGGPGVYLVRLASGGKETLEALASFRNAALARGAVLKGPLPNPDGQQLSRLTDALGADFRPEAAFLRAALARWSPGMPERSRDAFADALLAALLTLRGQGKSDSVLKTLYCKALCWLDTRFRPAVPLLGEDDPPRVLFETSAPARHELLFFGALSAAGADVLLLLPAGEAAYLRADPEGRASQPLAVGEPPFPAGFSLRSLPAPRPAAAPKPAGGSAPAAKPAPAKPPAFGAADLLARFPAPARTACTNAWMREAAYTEILREPRSRGDDPRLFFNAFVLVSGVPDKVTYLPDLHRFYQQLRAAGRAVVVQDGPLSAPTPEEIEKVRRRGRYPGCEEMIADVAGSLPASANAALQRAVQRAFCETLLEEMKTEPRVQRLVVSAVYLVCWFRRFQAPLFAGRREKENALPCYLQTGGCETRHEAVFLRFLARLPADVLILLPDRGKPCALESPSLLVLTGEDSLPVMKFPKDAASLTMRTVASHAEEELSGMLADSGLYRRGQFAKAEAVTLSTTSDEVFLLWDQELKYRPNFSAEGGAVSMPVLYAKISGVERGQVDAYWQKIRLLLTDETLLVPRLPMLSPGSSGPQIAMAQAALRDGRIRREALRAHRQYPFGLLREELQAHILDKLQQMLDERLIRGTFENGTEYTVLATVLGMSRQLLRLLQRFDFTKKNPKVVCVATDDRPASLEDAIMLTFLNLAGFDVALFVPTGYQTIERYLNGRIPVEHRVGEYLYDLAVPDFSALPAQKSRSWLDFIWKRGN